MNRNGSLAALMLICILACLLTGSCTTRKVENNESIVNNTDQSAPDDPPVTKEPVQSAPDDPPVTKEPVQSTPDDPPVTKEPTQNTSGDPPLETSYEAISIELFSDSINHARYQYKDSIPPYELYDPSQIAGIAENMINFQNADGGWPKNVDWARKWKPGEYENERILTADAVYKSTLDNRSTYSQIEYLAQVYQQLPEQKYAVAIEMGADWLIEAQHPESGGFSGADVDAITYNDDVMAGTLRVLRQIALDDELYGFLDQDRRQRAWSAYEKGLDCILKTQITVNGELTAWGQQHSHETLEPIWARDYEPPSITANESVGVLILLMGIENPSPEIKAAIVAGCEWLTSVKINGIRISRIPAEPVILGGRYYDYERIEEPDPSSPPLWARFYDLQTQSPIFYDRGGKQVAGYNELSMERRGGYDYYGHWPSSLLNDEYPQWKKLHGIE